MAAIPANNNYTNSSSASSSALPIGITDRVNDWVKRAYVSMFRDANDEKGVAKLSNLFRHLHTNEIPDPSTNDRLLKNAKAISSAVAHLAGVEVPPCGVFSPEDLGPHIVQAIHRIFDPNPEADEEAHHMFITQLTENQKWLISTYLAKQPKMIDNLIKDERIDHLLHVIPMNDPEYINLIISKTEELQSENLPGAEEDLKNLIETLLESKDTGPTCIEEALKLISLHPELIKDEYIISNLTMTLAESVVENDLENLKLFSAFIKKHHQILNNVFTKYLCNHIEDSYTLVSIAAVDESTIGFIAADKLLKTIPFPKEIKKRIDEASRLRIDAMRTFLLGLY